MSMVTNSTNVKVFDSPNEAPRYGNDVTVIKLTDAIVIKNGTINGHPTVDLQGVDADGNKYVILALGSIIEALGAAVTGSRLSNSKIGSSDGLH